jgi:hypothetical protein
MTAEFKKGDRVEVGRASASRVVRGTVVSVEPEPYFDVNVDVDGGRVTTYHVEDVRLIPAVDRLADLCTGIWPTEADIGRGVVYEPPHGGPYEDGAVTGFNESYVFVRYADQHPSASGKATPRKHLRWLSPADTDEVYQ